MAADGLTTIKSAYSAQETMARLEVAVAAKGMTVFAHIDHGAAAVEAGLPLRPTDRSPGSHSSHDFSDRRARSGGDVSVAKPITAGKDHAAQMDKVIWIYDPTIALRPQGYFSGWAGRGDPLSTAGCGALPETSRSHPPRLA
jgi:hypothetical protein